MFIGNIANKATLIVVEVAPGYPLLQKSSFHLSAFTFELSANSLHASCLFFLNQ